MVTTRSNSQSSRSTVRSSPSLHDQQDVLEASGQQSVPQQNDPLSQQSTQQPNSNSDTVLRDVSQGAQDDCLTSAIRNQQLQIEKLTSLVETLLKNGQTSNDNRAETAQVNRESVDDNASDIRQDLDDLESLNQFATPRARNFRDEFDGKVTKPENFIIEHLNTIQPPKFKGDRASARTWLTEYDSIMDANGCTEAKKVIKARAYMIDHGRSWYNVTSAMYSDLDWKTFKRQFLLDFCGPNAVEQLRSKLDATSQTSGEHPKDFAVRLLDLCIQVDPKMSETERVYRIVKGLRTHTRNMLSCINPNQDWELPQLLNLLAAQIVEQKAEKTETSQKVSNPKPSSTQDLKSTASPVKPKPKDLTTWECYNCGKKGHEIADCKEPINETLIAERKAAYRSEKLSKAVNVVHRDSDEAVKTSRLPCDDDPKPLLNVELNKLTIKGRIDSGADMTVISSDIAEKLKLQLLPWDSAPLSSANKSPLQVLGMATVLATINGVSKPILVVVIPKKSLQQVLWGNDLLRAFNMKLDFSQSSTGASTIPIDVNDRSTNSVTMTDVHHPLDKVKLGDLVESDKKQLLNTLVEFADVFSKSEEDIGRTSLIKHRIILTSDLPVHKKRYQVPFKHLQKMESIIERMKESGVIRDSVSPYAAPGFMVDKEGGLDKRLVADYRPLNAITIPDRTPMPHPDDVFRLLHGMKVFAKLDITAMFNQIAVDERDIEKTAMITHFGLFEFATMPFGLKNAPATAVRLMREVLRGLDEKICYVYFDDIIVFAVDIGQLIQRCIEVLKRLRTHNLKLKPSKCTFGMPEVTFLGHIISAQGVDIDPKRIEDVKRFPTPRNPTDVRSFYGLCSFNRKFIRDFAKIAKPMTPLMNAKPSEFAWTTDAQAAFETLRDNLTSAPTLVHYNPEAEHELRTDASSFAIGAVLYQKHDDADQTGVVLYYSKTLNKAQRNYSATEREMLAAFNAITNLKHYLLGKRFILVTDHSALSMLRNHKDPHQRLARWIAQLMAYDFEVRYKSGSTHKDADCLSRLVQDRDEPNEDQEVDVDDLIDPRDVARDTDFIRAINSVSSQNGLGNEDQASNSNDNLNLADIRTEQREDQFCKRHVDTLEDETLTDEQKAEKAYSFTIQDGKLYRCQTNGTNALVVPARRRAAVLLSCHDSPLGGHFGFQKTFSQIRSRFYWPKMRRDVKQHVQSCTGCQLRKPPNSKRQGLTMPLPIAENVFDTIGIDLIVRLPTSQDGYNTLLVCTDNLSKFAIVVPLKNELGQSVRHAFFNHVVTKYGCPKVVISDRGGNLINSAQKDFFDLFGIKRQLTSAFHPQSNGQTERFNRTLAASLTIFIERNQRDWPEFVQAITFAYNISEHIVTKTSPYELVFGRRPRIPIDNILGRDDFVDPQNLHSVSRSSESMNIMKKLIAESQLANKRRLDRKLAKCNFQEGDLVVVERPTRVKGGTHKLSYTYIGPYKIKRKLGDLSFELEDGTHRLKSYVVHPCHLRKFIRREGVVADDLVDPDFIAREMIETREVSDETETCSEIDDMELTLPPVLSPHGIDAEHNDVVESNATENAAGAIESHQNNAPVIASMAETFPRCDGTTRSQSIEL